MHNFRIVSELIRLSDNAVRKPHAESDQKITFRHTQIRRLRPVHAEHSHIVLIRTVKGSFAHERIGHRRVYLLDKFF